MKKSILFSLFFVLFTFVAFAQDEEAEIEELDAPPSLDELLERPKPIKVDNVDNFVNATYDLYDKVIEVRKDGEANGWPEQAVLVSQFQKEYFKLAKETAVMAATIKNVPKLKLIFATKNFIASKKALSHSYAHLKYMRSQYTDEEWAQVESAEGTEPAAEGDGDGGQR